MSDRYPRGAKVVENKANGPAAISTARKLKGIPGLIAENPKGDKPARARAIAAYVEAGNIYLPSPYDRAGNPRPDRAWVLRLIQNCATYPNGSIPIGSHGDDVDALTQAINYLMNKKQGRVH